MLSCFPLCLDSDKFQSRLAVRVVIMSQNFLVEIPIESLPTLRDKFLVEWPKHIIAFSLIDNFVSRFERNPKSIGNVKFYCLNGNWENGTFVAVMVRENLNSQGNIFVLISVLA